MQHFGFATFISHKSVLSHKGRKKKNPSDTHYKVAVGVYTGSEGDGPVRAVHAFGMSYHISVEKWDTKMKMQI